MVSGGVKCGARGHEWGSRTRCGMESKVCGVDYKEICDSLTRVRETAALVSGGSRNCRFDVSDLRFFVLRDKLSSQNRHRGA